jgi:dihydrolipoamide dehydrogenase
VKRVQVLESFIMVSVLRRGSREMTEQYDVIVIGAGPAGENVAGRVANGGASCLIVEKELVGGECSYWACMPSKALLRPGEVLRMARRVPGARAALTGKMDVEDVLARRDAIISDLDDSGQVKWLDDNNIAYLRGHGRLDGKKKVIVTDSDGTETSLQARKAVVLATGSQPAIPPIPGLREVALGSRDITTLKHPPGRLVVLGGGVVGVEMAQAWNDLGATSVTIVERADRLLAREEPFAGQHIRKVFEEEYGIEVFTGTAVKRVRREGAEVVCALSDGSELRSDNVLVATGRRPNTEDIGLDTVGLEPGRYIEVDDELRTSGENGEWLFAVGDANGRSLLTHDGKYQGRICGDVILGKQTKAWGDRTASPRVIFTDPQVAAVGLTAATARERGLNVRAVDYGFGAVAGSTVTGQGIDGTCRWVVDVDTGTLVGATFLGPGAGEMLHAATIAVAGRVPVDVLWHATPAFPTISEVWLRFLEEYGC